MKIDQSLFTRQARKRLGFSFIEIMVVVIILGLLAGITGVYFFDAASKARADTTTTQIRSLGTALDLYRLHNTGYPTTEQSLAALLKKPELGIPPKNWNGPYIRDKKLPTDGWGNNFRYIGSSSDYEIISLGADGVEGGSGENADISSNNL